MLFADEDANALTWWGFPDLRLDAALAAAVAAAPADFFVAASGREERKGQDDIMDYLRHPTYQCVRFCESARLPWPHRLPSASTTDRRCRLASPASSKRTPLNAAAT